VAVIGKAARRLTATTRRRAMSAATRDPADRAIAAAAAELVRDALRAHPGAVICAYSPMAAEPGGQYLLPALEATGADLLLPIVLPDLDLDWRRHQAPEGEQNLGREAVRSAALLLVPALAVDRSGVRLGRGGGSYDRALARVPPTTAVVALLYDGELVDELPAEPHDRRVTAVLTPSGMTKVT